MKTSNNNHRKEVLKKGGLVLLACSTLFTSAVGVSAYFSDKEESVNTFTVGKVDIDHKEPIWDKLPEEEKVEVTPNKEIAKDPQIENTGNNAAFVFQTVEVPCANVVTANADGTKNPLALTDMFSWKVNSGWTLMSTEDVKEGSNVVAHKYTYVYGTAEKCTALEEGKTTVALFDSVKMANIVEGQGLETTTQEIKINAYGIQTTDLGDNDTTAPSQVLAIIYNQAK